MNRFVPIVLAFLVYACDNHKDYFYNIDATPVIQLSGTSLETGNAFSGVTSFSDSLKTGHVYTFNYKILSSLKNSISYTTSSNYSFSINNSVIGIKGLLQSANTIYLVATDTYGKIGLDTVNLTIFDNLPPVAILNSSTTNLNGSYILTLDGSASYDRDAKYGGHITNYQYTINGTVYTNTNSSFTCSVNLADTYTVKFQVQDNNGAWSNLLTTYITITNS